MRGFVVVQWCSLLVAASAFLSVGHPPLLRQKVLPTHQLLSSSSSSKGLRAPCVVVAKAAAAAAELEPGRLSVKIGSKALNGWGVLFGASMAVWVVALYPLVLACAGVSYVLDGKRRRPMDVMVSLWAKVSMLVCGYRPQLVGAENLPRKGEAVMYVPNHGSYLDILTLSGFLRRKFKYISKIEILRIPLIGWSMAFAGHVALKRADRRSQLETYKSAVESLKNGNSIVAFPEGTRSPDGTLRQFKRGPFKMAKDAGVDVVPVAIADLQKFHPTTALMPLARPRGVTINVLPRIKTKDADVQEVLEEAWNAVNDALPHRQQSTKETPNAYSD